MTSARFMNAALNLAARGLGQTWPNPAVGAVIVKDNAIIGQGHTQRGGRPHAETQALKQAGENARGGAMYVTLEPCAHLGQTPPCTDAIIAAGISKVIVACRDPNPQVNGAGVARLKAAGMEVEENICRAAAEKLNEGFFSQVVRKRPFISLKIATSLDGKIATRSGQSQWITGARARNYAHLLRSRYDAVVTGIGTVLADNPHLTCRLPGLEERSPVRVVLDRQKRIPKNAAVLAAQDHPPTWILPDATLDEALTTLGEKGITRLMVEAGSTLSTSFLQEGLVDRIYWFRAPTVIGEDGLAACGGGFPAELEKLARFTRQKQITLDTDTLEIFECSPAS